jgi:lipid II isoglutaminyl synthase (glutamine-hydrolysing)
MKAINILHLYPNEMNTYGDHGNALTLKRRLEWRGYEPKVSYHHPGGTLPKTADIVIGGGGQDSAQEDVQADILRIGTDLRQMAEKNLSMLMVCGMFQLFGHRYLTQEGVEVKGIGIFDAETVAGNKRMIGNVMIKTEFGVLFGFENHSGQTTLGPDQPAFGKVLRGGGNNGRDQTEGARLNNTFGTYLHGPLLPNNPLFCDELIKLAAMNKFGEFKPKKIDDGLAQITAAGAKRRKY